MSSPAIEKSGEAVEPAMTAAEIRANARALSGFLREKSDAIEEARRLPGQVAARLRQAGMFRLMMPQEWGGPEMRPAEQVEVIEELAKAKARTENGIAFVRIDLGVGMGGSVAS